MPNPIPGAFRQRLARRIGILLSCAACALAGGTALAGGVAGPAGTVPPSTVTTPHVAIIVMENKEAGGVLGRASSRYLNALARRYGQATASYAVAHPSLPNYLALTSGSTHGISSDCTACRVSGENLGGQLSAAGRSWKAYMEGYPGDCNKAATVGPYAKRHDPFLYYTDIAASPQLCAHIVGFGALGTDLKAGRLPMFAWITPNICNDTHDCGIVTGDRFLARMVPPLLSAVGPHGYVVITWDEGTSTRGIAGGHGGHIATVVAGPDVIRGGRMRAPVDHYGVLATIERTFGLAALGHAADPGHGSLAPLFRTAPVIGPVTG